MSKPSPRILVSTSGVVRVRARGAYHQHHNPIGSIRRASGGGYEYTAVSASRCWFPAPNAAMAILGCVHSWQRWVGLPPGTLHFD